MPARIIEQGDAVTCNRPIHPFRSLCRNQSTRKRLPDHGFGFTYGGCHSPGFTHRPSSASALGQTRALGHEVPQSKRVILSFHRLSTYKRIAEAQTDIRIDKGQPATGATEVSRCISQPFAFGCRSVYCIHWQIPGF